MSVLTKSIFWHSFDTWLLLLVLNCSFIKFTPPYHIFIKLPLFRMGMGGEGGGLATLEAEKLSNLPFALFEHS